MNERAFDEEFWHFVDELLSKSRIVVDRPKGTPHPRYQWPYPLDYGYLEGTATTDGSGIDVWVGSGRSSHVEAIACTIDLRKRDMEIKLLVGCSEAETEQAVRLMSSHSMRCVLIRRREGRGKVPTGGEPRQ